MRTKLYVSIVAMLAILSVVAWNEARGFERRFEDKQRADAQRFLRQQVDFEQERLGQAVSKWLGELADPEVLDERVPRHREAIPFYDAAYVWEGERLVWPAMPVFEDASVLRQDPCFKTSTKAAPEEDAIELARRHLECTSSPRDGVRLLAVSDAAEALLNDGYATEANWVLQRSGYLRWSLGDATKVAVSPSQLVYLRVQWARALEDLALVSEARRVLRSTAAELAAQNGPVLEMSLDLYTWPLAALLANLGQPGLGGDDDEEYTRAQRRLQAWHEIERREWATADLQDTSEPTVLVDRYGGDTPWIVYVARLSQGNRMGAIQVDQPGLVRALYGGIAEELRPALSIRDTSGRVLAGDPGPTAIDVAFDRVAPHLHAALSASVLDDEGAERRALFGHLAPMAFAIGIGLVALWGMIRSDRQQQQMLAQQREFMARVTHELKTPIAGIQLMAENLEMGAFRGDEGRIRFSQQIIKEADRLTRRVDEILRAARGPVDETTEVVDVCEMLRGIGERWKGLFEQRNATLRVEAPGSIRCRVRPDQLRDALTNLVDNALKYGREDRPLEVELRVTADRRWVTFQVEDNGIGVPMGMRKTIFERFRRVEGPGRGKSGGHGLGLDFVATAARQAGGKVDCRDGKDGGALFTLRIRRKS